MSHKDTTLCEIEAADLKSNKSDKCRVSCVDWYGNARPIFLGYMLDAL